jgi:hypothetical protein
MKVQFRVGSTVSYGDAMLWCSSAAVMSGGGTVPGNISPSPTEDTPDHQMAVPSNEARGHNEPARVDHIPMGPGAARGDAIGNAFAYLGTTAACVDAVTHTYR